MNANEIYELLTRLLDASKEILIGGIGGVIAYMVDYKRQKAIIADFKWSYGAMFVNMCIGSFVAYVAGAFMPHDMAYRDGFIGLVGLTSYTIVGLIESRFAKLIVDIFMALTGGKDGK